MAKRRKSRKRRRSIKRRNSFGYKIDYSRIINSGGTADLYNVFEDNGLLTPYIAKVYRTKKHDIQKEIEIQNFAANILGIAPRVVWTDNKNIIIMEFINGKHPYEFISLYPHHEKLIHRKIIDAYDILYNNGINYTDKFNDNIIIDNNMNVYIIDFDGAKTEHIPENDREYDISGNITKDTMAIIRNREQIEQEKRLKEKIAKLGL